MKSTHTFSKLLFVFVLLFTACGKDNPAKDDDKKPIEEKPVPLTNKLRAYSNNPEDLANFIYNNDGNLVTYFSYNKGKPYYKISHFYKNKQRVGSNFYSDYGLGDTLTLFLKVDYTWVNGQISEVREDSPAIIAPGTTQTANLELTSLGYDGNGFLKTAKTEVLLNGIKTLKSDWRFITDAEGDVLKSEEDRYYQGQFQKTYKQSLLYDNKINPEWKLLSPMSFVTYFSPHNALKQTFENEIPYLTYSTISTYKYNASGLPVELSREQQGNGIKSYLYYDYYK